VGQREGTVEDMVNPWQNTRIFLTGHTGFKGGWLALWLANRGAVIRGYSLGPPTEPNLFTVASVSSVLEDVRGDIREYSKLEAAMSAFAPEVVFHLAAQPLVRRSYSDPLGTYATNVMGTAHVLEAVRKTPSVRAVVCVTTDKCYQNHEWTWPYRESDALGGHDPYSSSKACAELVTAAYRSSFFPLERLAEHPVAVATARAGNVIGGGDWAEDRLIPDLIRGFQEKKPVLIRRPGATRPWQHVLDPIRGYIVLAEKLLAQKAEYATAYNFGPSDEDPWSVECIANKLVGLWGNGAAWKADSAGDLHESHCLRLDASKARAELNWKARLRIEKALEWTMNWYRRWQQGADMHQETLAQIREFEKLSD